MVNIRFSHLNKDTRIDMKNINKILKKINDNCLMIISALLSIIVALQVFSRYVFSIPLPWSTDVIRLLFVYMVFLGAVAGSREDSHIKIDFLFEKFPLKIKNIISILMSLIVIIFLIIFFKSGVDFFYNSRTQLTPYLRISVSFYYIIIPISAFLMIYYSICNILKQLKNSLLK